MFIITITVVGETSRNDILLTFLIFEKSTYHLTGFLFWTDRAFSI